MNNKNYNTDQDINRAKRIANKMSEYLNSSIFLLEISEVDDNCTGFDNSIRETWIENGKNYIGDLHLVLSLQTKDSLEDEVMFLKENSPDINDTDNEYSEMISILWVYHNYIQIITCTENDAIYTFIEVDLFEILIEWLNILHSEVAFFNKKENKTQEDLYNINRKIENIFQEKYGHLGK